MAAAHAEPHLPLTDEALVERIRAGDRDCFDTLYARYLPRIYSFVSRRLGNRADVEETVQEVFISVFASLHGFRGEASFAAWLFGVTRRTIAARFKRKRHETVPLPTGEEDYACFQMASADPSPHETCELSERLEQLDELARMQLTEEQRLLFQLHHLEDRSIQDIARCTERSVDSVKSHLYRARKVLFAR